MTDIKSKATNGFLWSTIERFGVQGLQFTTTIYLARILGPEDFGLFAIIAVFIALSDVFINSGFSYALIQKTNRTEVDYSTMFYFNLFVSIIIYVLFYFSSPLLESIYTFDGLSESSRIAFLCLIANAIAIVGNTKLTIKMDFQLKAKLNLVSIIISATSAIYVAQIGYGYWALIVLTVVKSFVYSLLVVIFCKWRPLLIFSIVSFKELFSFGYKLLISGIINTISNNVYSMVIGKQLSIRELGFYTQGRQVPELLSGNLTAIFGSVAFPILSKEQQNKERLISIFKRVYCMLAFISIPAMLGLAMLSHSFVIVFLTEKWLPAVNVMFILCVARSLTPLAALNMSLLGAIGRSDLYLKLEVVKIPSVLIILIVSVHYGLTGISIGLLLLGVITFIVNAFYTGKFYNYGVYRQLKDIKGIILASILMCCCIALNPMTNPYYKMPIDIVIGIISYVSFALVFKIDSLNEILNIILKRFQELR